MQVMQFMHGQCGLGGKTKSHPGTRVCTAGQASFVAVVRINIFHIFSTLEWGVVGREWRWRAPAQLLWALCLASAKKPDGDVSSMLILRAPMLILAVAAAHRSAGCSARFASEQNCYRLSCQRSS